ncbi:MAG: endo-1,4-beta-xylanase, partial [Acetatifactor sp.]|nr:endo-1,4-beta-xylanase [Acetatifactor sp.]
MWGTAVWGNATITAKTSDTPIVDNIYTYGEITNRESPYHSFAQDVTDRTVPGTGYKFSFWAKLSDDYKDAPANQRVIEFSPYYLDGNGKEVYSMTRTGVYQQVLEPGVWSHFTGVVGLPWTATGFVIRIVEQGTNYGQGECVKGSYAVTNVTLTPTDYPPEPTWGRGGGGNRSNTITKEATCEITYELDDLAIDWASATAKTSGDKLNVSFTNNYDEVRLKLPRTLDMSTCAYIKVSIPAQNVPIAIKLYRKGKQVDVSYYNDISTSYLMVPVYDGLIDAIGIMSLATPNPAGAYALADCITFGLTEEPAPEEKSNTIVINGDFADEDLSDWYAALWGDGVTITQHTNSTPIFGNTYTYATYSRRTSPYQCFAQDITDRVEQNETYTFSFWAKLSNDYKGAPENQRVVQFAPYTVDKSGKENYNPRLEGNYSQVLEPGVWTYFEGTYKVTHDNPIAKVVIRILEQGTNYGQGECVKGSFSVAGVHMEKYIPEPPSIDEDVPNLKDVTAEVFGDDFIMGTAVTLNEIEDIGIEMLVNKHFNAVTIGNELKPDALFNYSNDEHTPLQTITFNGETLEVPTLYYGRAEEILDTLKKWNEDHPDDPIKVRGHVLVWHSQTPEWFFREGYTVKQNADGSENYVTPEVMNLRLEWYIKTVLEHFTGEDSPYKDMFYGWDVLNEAIYNGYRTDKVSSNEPLSQSTHSANSSWWAVYQSNEFIINAFRFANQYAPADVELYYNDYNECDNKKVVGIVKLLKDVQEAEGTRIDGMGMQGHYNMVSPTIKEIERAIRDYSEVVDKVMYTEFDMKVGGDISRDELLQKEYISQAERYHDIYVLLKKLNAEDGINIGGFTVWGTVDKYSWLQNSSNVGGGADGTLTQCPLLFDSNYKVKPSYWAFVDYTMVDPDWTEASEEEEPKQETVETPETPEEVETPETQPEAEPVVDTNPVVEEQKKNSPVAIVAVAVGAVVVGAGAGAGLY